MRIPLADSVARVDSCMGTYRVPANRVAEQTTSARTAAPDQDSSLIHGLRAGAEPAYEELIALFQQPVYTLVYRLVDSRDETCDVVQDVFLKVFRNIGAFRGQSSLKTWIYRIAINEAYNHRRWYSRRRFREIRLEGQEDESRNGQCLLGHSGGSPYEITLNHETRALIEEALAGLNPNFRTAVVLRDIEELSYEEIAEVLQVSLGTVKSRILRGREALRKILSSRLEHAPALELVATTG